MENSEKNLQIWNKMVKKWRKQFSTPELMPSLDSVIDKDFILSGTWPIIEWSTSDCYKCHSKIDLLYFHPAICKKCLNKLIRETGKDWKKGKWKIEP